MLVMIQRLFLNGFAFQSHVPAYEKAGVLQLSILDKVRIVLTPDASDLLSTEGLEQAKRVELMQCKMLWIQLKYLNL